MTHGSGGCSGYFLVDLDVLGTDEPDDAMRPVWLDRVTYRPVVGLTVAPLTR